MALLQIILMIVQAIPTIIKIVEMLRERMKDMPKEQRKAHTVELKGILQRFRAHRDARRATAEVEQLVKKLG